ncbi:(2Fe-2S)-binding protein [Gilvimarinus sp. SDUM040013]|uniref:(2Fe-2S)-binding protein n=1 Tax=Gilvimarinus gilvus TaxID=3058038 RepID=A0ABU4RYM4_9GAMM|nr:(2Fe-2S)-binding protein [Gilvimarinus sp. SDUM040013]MDO3385633.1 (2Fe-2S)-binding protein [Gilvimarinus sp. SDUM040013]MDX6849967.1 (2Fe-2S)-binding protein [Gilvimarinus sp. SDUM040013]
MKLNVNGKTQDIDVESDTPLLWVLREQLGLTGTKYGCGISMCGACTVHIDGVAQRSCVLPVSAVREDQKITTIEGLGVQQFHPVQDVWAEIDVPQCGYCQSGMIMAASSLLAQNSDPSDDDIRRGMGNICRCGTYPRVIEGIKKAAKQLRANAESGGQDANA